MPNQSHPQQVDPNTNRTRKVAAILAACAVVVWGAAALLTSTNSTSAFVDDSSPVATDAGADPSSATPAGADDADAPVDPADPVDPEEPTEPQVPLGGNGDLAPTPTTDPPSCGFACVAPVDLHPFEQETGHMPVGIGFASGGDGGCSTECITRAQVFPAHDSTDIAIEVETHTLAFIAIYVDDEEPHVTDDGRPYFPGAQPVVNTHGDLATWFADTLTDLREDTRYWIIVRATDSDVRSSFVVGSVVTPRLASSMVIALTD